MVKHYKINQQSWLEAINKLKPEQVQSINQLTKAEQSQTVKYVAKGLEKALFERHVFTYFVFSKHEEGKALLAKYMIPIDPAIKNIEERIFRTYDDDVPDKYVLIVAFKPLQKDTWESIKTAVEEHNVYSERLSYSSLSNVTAHVVYGLLEAVILLFVGYMCVAVLNTGVMFEFGVMIIIGLTYGLLSEYTSWHNPYMFCRWLNRRLMRVSK